MPDSDPLRESGSTYPSGKSPGVPSAKTPLPASRNGERVAPDLHGKASDPNHQPDSQRGMIPRDSLRFAGAGLELAGSTIVLATLGYLLDRKLENSTPIAMALGGLLGFAAGMLRFVRLAIEVSRRAERSDRPGLALAKARAEREASTQLDARAEEKVGLAELKALADAKANFQQITQTHSSESVGKAGRSQAND